MRELGNERIRKWENGARATRKVLAERINFAKVSNFGKVCATKSDTSELSEGNGEERKRAEKNFGEKGC